MICIGHLILVSILIVSWSAHEVSSNDNGNKEKTDKDKENWMVKKLESIGSWADTCKYTGGILFILHSSCCSCWTSCTILRIIITGSTSHITGHASDTVKEEVVWSFNSTWFRSTESSTGSAESVENVLVIASLTVVGFVSTFCASVLSSHAVWDTDVTAS